LDAARNALEMLKGIHLTAETTIEEAMLSSDTIKSEITGRLYGLRRLGKPRYFSDGSIRVRIVASLQKILPSKIYPQDSNHVAPILKNTNENVSDYTGLILDARGKILKPAISPRILDENQNLLYSSISVNPKILQKKGVVAYAQTIEQARNNERVGQNPWILKALATTGKQPTDIVLNRQDSIMVQNLSQQSKILKRARVIFLSNTFK